MKKKNEKTNVMRILDSAKVEHSCHFYYDTDAVAGVDVAAVLGEDPAHVYKTLVTVGASGEHYVFLVPVKCNLNLKKASRAVGEKSVEMIPAKKLLPLTGYVHGGCSPIGMKKQFRCVIDSSVENFDTIFFSAGKIGYQVELSPSALRQVLDYETCDICDEV